jgi:RNA polymerase sigma factor (sigma-70 family)
MRMRVRVPSGGTTDAFCGTSCLLLLLLDPCLSQLDEGARSFLPFRDESRLNGCSTMTMELSDAQLVGRCRNGEAAAWNELVERFSRYVYAIAVRAYRLAEHDAEDVFQEVFARAYERLGSLRDDDAIRPWLAQLTRNACVDRLRAAAREQPAEEPAAEATDPMLEQLDEALDVRVGLESLSEDCRDILDRFFARDESYRIIGEALDLPAGTIASRISRCLGKLREKLEGRKAPTDSSGGV